ncbi:Flp pilus assembly complex ATPase component TadA [Candidatus Woesearchaeota archaeon]|nr:Flp pilus assembly complex ATPase component TadA [Candidatus Woesearchaeota archaeon]
MPEQKPCGSYTILREGEEIILRIDAEACSFFPSIEDNPTAMAMAIDIIAEVGTITKLVFAQKRDYEYDYSQALLLTEIARLHKQFVKQKLTTSLLADPACRRFIDARYAEMQDLLYRLLKSDPIGAYVELVRIHRRETGMLRDGGAPREAIACIQKYISVLSDTIASLEATRLISIAKPYIAGYKIGDRNVYRRIFAPTIRPDFMFTKLMAAFPPEGEELASYKIGNAEVTIFSLPNTVQYLYHVVPPEFKMAEEKYELLDAARKIMAEHKPKRSEFVDPERMRQVFTNVGSDLIDELSQSRGITMRESERDELVEILVRYTVGFGLIEVLLGDERVQDISINSPMGRIPMFIVHQDFGDCITNIIPTLGEAESWASKLRLISGRPLDEANPILDTELVLPTARARIAAITAPLNPTGLAYSFRRHRDKPWTLPLFMSNRMLTPMGAGLLSFIIDGARTVLVAGTRSAGKTSLLGSLMVEIMRRVRIITIEDSVTGDSEMVIRRNGRCERLTIGQLIDGLISTQGSWYTLTDHEVTGNPANVEVLAMDANGRITFSRASKFIRHKVSKPIHEVTTRTGRQLKVTADHSLFGMDEKGDICEVKVCGLQAGDRIAVPKQTPLINAHREAIDLTQHVLSIDEAWLQGPSIQSYCREHRSVVVDISLQNGYPRQSALRMARRGVLPAAVVRDLTRIGLEAKEASFRIGAHSAHWMPLRLELTDELLCLTGLWLADGSYDANSVIISVVDQQERNVVREVARQVGLPVHMHSDQVSLMLHSKTFKAVLKDCLGLAGTAYTKRIPGWVFGLSPEQIGCVLKGLFSGDGCVSKNEILLAMASRGLLQDVQTLLLGFGVTMRVGKMHKDKTYRSAVSDSESCKRFRHAIGLLQAYKDERLGELCKRVKTHDTTDVLPLSKELKLQLAHTCQFFNKHDYITRENDIGRTHLLSLLEDAQITQTNAKLKQLALSDVLWDEVVNVKVVSDAETIVYDISVPECESFVVNNIVAHNTLELPVSSLRELDYNIQSMKVASALTRGTTEVAADEGIRTTLRLGDSALIVGEVRSTEARALYEAMRVGALANVVMGTIHSDSPYGVFDRVVNDLNVPRTSFKATDIAVIANPIRSPDGLHRFRRITQITEIRKHWTDDPVTEGGFVDLMKYDSRTDSLQPTDDLINGESEILKAIAGNVREWAGNWDAVWDNIQLRSQIKQAILEASQKLKRPDVLEAGFVIDANDQFHRISERVREEIGALDSKRILVDWNEWLKRNLRKV